MNLPGPGTARLGRDDWGAAHVVAETESEAFFALGWAQAQDDVATLLQRTALAHGVGARVLGEVALVSDLAAAQWHHVAESRAGLDRLEPAAARAISAWTDGVRAWIERHPGVRPSNVPVPQPWQVLAASRSMLWWYSWVDAVTAIRAAGIEPDLLAENGAVPSWASNQIAVSPARTADGHAMLISDIHTGPDRKFEHTLRAGDLEYYGTSLLGGAFPALGHNARVAWALTTGAPRVSDAFVVRTDPANPRRWYLDDVAHEMVVEEVEVEVAGNASAQRTFEYVRLGEILCPVAAREDDHAFVVATPYMHRAEAFDSTLYRFLRVTSAGELTATARATGFYPQNVMAADVDGGLSYARVGLVPQRADDVDPALPVEASNTTLWRGLRKPDELIQVDDPPDGWMQNCNAAPDTLLGGQSHPAIDSERVPSDVFHDLPGRRTSRGVRAGQLVAEATALTEDQWIAIALDEFWVDVPAWKRALATIPKDVVAGHGLRDAVDRLLDFDGQAHAESAAAHLWLRWRERLCAADVPIERLVDLQDRVLASGEIGGDVELVVEHLAAAVDELISTHGRLDVALGEVFRAGRPPLDVPIGGASYLARPPRSAADTEIQMSPLRVMVPSPLGQGNRFATHGGWNLIVTVLSEPIRSYSAILPGQSGDPSSPHHADRLQLLAQRRVRPTRFDPDDLADHLHSTEVVEVVTTPLSTDAGTP